MEIEWKRLNWPFQEYSVSNTGIVRDNVRNRLCAQYPNGGSRVHKYMSVSLESHFDDKRYILYVHRLVAEYFCQKPEAWNKTWVVHHIDSDPLNNHWTNLQWMDKSVHAKLPKTSFSPKTRISPELIFYLYHLANLGIKPITLEKVFGVTNTIIYNIKNKKYKNMDSIINSQEWVLNPKNIFKFVKNFDIWENRLKDLVLKREGETKQEWLARIKEVDKRKQTIIKFNCEVCGKETTNIMYGKWHKECKLKLKESRNEE